MPQNFFIMGDPGCGKTTLLKELIAKLKARRLKVGGFVSPEERHHGTRTAFHVRSIESGRIGLLADMHADGPKVSKYHVGIHSFEDIALSSLESAERCDVVVIDEIGPMECKSQRFIDRLDEIIDSDVPLIATLHESFKAQYAAYGQVVTISGGNKESILARLTDMLSDYDRKGVVPKKVEAKRPLLKAVPKKSPAKKKTAKAKPGDKSGKAKAVKKGKRSPASKKAPRKGHAKASPSKGAVKRKEAKSRPAEKPRESMSEGKPSQSGEKPRRKGVVHRIRDFFGF
jgi:nucleoside-triphosphatase